MMPNKSIYRDADAAEINLYELNFARFFSIQTSENGWRRVVCELVRRAAKGTKELRLEDGTELPGEKTFPDYVVDLMDSYLAVLPDAKPHAYPAAEREQLMERHCRHTEDGGIDYDYYQDMTLDTFIFNMRNVGAGALYAKRGPFWHGGHMEQCHFEELFRLIEEEGEKVFGETQERYADLAANDITAEAEHQPGRHVQPAAAKCRSGPFPLPCHGTCEPSAGKFGANLQTGRDRGPHVHRLAAQL